MATDLPWSRHLIGTTTGNQNQQTAIQASDLVPTNDKESTIVCAILDGECTAILSGANGTTCLGLVQIYDLDLGNGSRLTNLSTWGFVQAEPSLLIAGVIVSGSTGQRVVLRAIGPRSRANACRGRCRP